jgi:uncharacterized phage protein (TIGR01671 family)
MQPVHSLCFNAGGAIWYGAGNSFGWCWVDESFDGWSRDNPKPGEENMTTLMRWTGLKDRAGVDIYEGDIVEYCFEMPGFYKAPDLNFGEVLWNKDTYGFQAVDNIRLAESGDPVWIPLTNSSVRVVGNRCQNPELLKS